MLVIFLYILLTWTGLANTACSPAVDSDLRMPVPLDDRLLTREYLAFRFRNGSAQRDWINAINVQVSEFEGDREQEIMGHGLSARLARSWRAGSIERVRKWVEDNRESLEVLISLTAPAGAVPVGPKYSITYPTDVGLQSTSQMHRVNNLLLAAAVTTTDDQKRIACFRAMENLCRLRLAGCELLEYTAAVLTDLLKWRVLLAGLFDDVDRYRPIVLGSPDVVSMIDLACAFRECEGRYYLWAASDPKQSIVMAPKPLNSSQIVTMKRHIHELAELIESQSSFEEFLGFMDRIQDPLVLEAMEHIIRIELARDLANILFLEDFRNVTRAIAKSGIDGAVRIETRFFELHREGSRLFAHRGDRSMQIWPPPEDMSLLTFKQLISPEEWRYPPVGAERE